MILIHNFNLSLKEYADREIENDFPAFGVCPNCNCSSHKNLYKNGYYKRYAKDESMVEPVQILIHRLKCTNCKKSFSILPSFIIPYFQHTVTTVLKIVKDALEKKHQRGTKQNRWYYKKRFLKGLNWSYSYLNEMVERFDYSLPERLAEICLEKMFTIGCQDFFLSSWNYLDNHLMAL